MNEKGIKIPEENFLEPTVLLGALLFGTNYLKLQHRIDESSYAPTSD